MDFSSFPRRFVDFILPRNCELCAEPTSELLCRDCVADLPVLQHCCEVCALPLTHETAVCGECQRTAPSFNAICAGFTFANPLGFFINQCKHQRKRGPFQFLATAMEARLRDHIQRHGTPDLLAAVPLHWTTLYFRSFNQAEILARLWGHRLQIPFQPIIKKIKRSEKQQQLSRKERLRNLKNVFHTTKVIRDKYIVLVDDVVTTGATVETIARLLKGKGAARVDVWALARTPKAGQR